MPVEIIIFSLFTQLFELFEKLKAETTSAKSSIKVDEVWNWKLEMQFEKLINEVGNINVTFLFFVVSGNYSIDFNLVGDTVTETFF